MMLPLEPPANSSEDVREKAISEALATAMRGITPEAIAEKQQMSELLPSLTEVFFCDSDWASETNRGIFGLVVQ